MAENKGNSGALAKRGVLKMGIKDERTLYACYMPFIKGCGIFYPNVGSDYKVGDEAFILMTLPNAKKKYAVSAKVVWLNPEKKLGKRMPGAGFQILGKEAEEIRKDIEEQLGKKLDSPLPTATM